MKRLGNNERQVTEKNDNEWFHDSYSVGEPRNESTQQSKYNTNTGCGQHNDEERQNTSTDVNPLDMLGSDFTQTLEHVVQYLDNMCNRLLLAQLSATIGFQHRE